MEEENKKNEEPKQEMSSDLLRQLAADIADDKIFTHRHIPEGQSEMVPRVFMPIALGAFKDTPQEELENIGLIYEYYSAAGPRGINGYPCFFSFRTLTVEETKKMEYFYKIYVSMKETFLGTEDTKEDKEENGQ